MYGAVRLYTPFEQPESNDISPVSDDEDPFSICLDVFNRPFGCSDILIKDEDLIEGYRETTTGTKQTKKRKVGPSSPEQTAWKFCDLCKVFSQGARIVQAFAKNPGSFR